MLAAWRALLHEHQSNVSNWSSSMGNHSTGSIGLGSEMVLMKAVIAENRILESLRYGFLHVRDMGSYSFGSTVQAWKSE